MKRIVCLVVLTVLVFAFVGSCAADGPPVSIEGKLLGFAAPYDALAVPELAAAYEKSGATAAVLMVEWGKIEPSDPGSGASKYDFPAFDGQPFAKSAKTRIVWISLANPWADKIRASNPERYWKLAEGFVTELAKHANEMGITHFAVRIEQEKPESSVGPTAASVEPLKRIYKAVKAASEGSTVIAEQPYGSGANAIQLLYRIGAKGSFDVAAINAISKAGGLVDPFQLVAAHRELAANGDGGKKLLALGGWEPTTALGEIPWSAIQDGIAADLRNILTERDIYDPAWVLGEIISLPERPSADFIAAFPPKPCEAKLEAQITSEGPIFNYVTEKPYKLTLTLTNLGKEEITLGELSAAIRWPKEMSVKSQLEGAAPVSVPAGGSATINFTITLPKEAAGQQVTLVGSVDYTVAGKKHVADCWLTLMATPQFEITLLPARLILDPREGAKRVGMSVINHTEAEFQGKITVTTYPGITASPTEFPTKIDALGLEAFVYSVTADAKTAPGHYAVFVDVDGKAKEWQAVDVPVVAKKVAGKIAIDGKLGEWEDAATFPLTTVGYLPKPAGKGWLAYDDSALYVGLEMTMPIMASVLLPSDSLFVGLDPLLNGARAAAGGYKEDDYGFELTESHVVKLNQAPPTKQLGTDKNVQFASRSEGGKTYYEIAFPWSEIAPLKPVKGTTFAMALQRDRTMFGGELGGSVDPRKFLPVVLGE